MLRTSLSVVYTNDKLQPFGRFATMEQKSMQHKCHPVLSINLFKYLIVIKHDMFFDPIATVSAKTAPFLHDFNGGSKVIERSISLSLATFMAR